MLAANSDQDPFRAETAGVRAITLLVRLLCSIYHITQGRIEIGLDGDSTKTQLEQPYRLKVGCPHYDMLSEVRHEIKSLPVEVRL